MNCQTFSELASDIAGDQMMDAAARAQALAHSSDCASCAAWLNTQQRLTADLRELASATKDESPSNVVWENLSAAFDTRAVAHITTKGRRRIYAAGAIAATLVLAFAGSRLVWHRQQATVQGSIAASLAPAPLSQTTGEGREKNISVAINKKAPQRNSQARRTLTPQANQPKEIATDFISLTYGDTEVGSDAQMVRVELPRSAMAVFGLPVNMDRADQRVKADVLLGADGLARAIRFVQ
ncbi:MAG: hypothetical protein ACXW18_03485 [Pyrinomonadaceae bacterium]